MSDDDRSDAPKREGKLLSVLALNELARTLLERGASRVWVLGEVTDVTRSAVGHLYFTLGDGRAQVKCMMFRTDVTRVALALVPGTRVEVRGGLTLYEARGTYQLQVSEVIEAGLGARAAEIARLKKKLAADGLLDPTKKRALPRYPAVVGVVTSRDGAAWRDVVKVALDRFPARLVLVHAIVQGPDAPEQIVRALAEVQRLKHLSVIVLARGGGASEDLAAFDDERVARAVASTRVPIVTGVGHEIDVTLADLCADVRAATPSNAAELAVPSIAAIRDQIATRLRALQRGIDRVIDQERLALTRETRALSDPRALLRPSRSKLAAAERTIGVATRRAIARERQRLSVLADRLAKEEPRARLGRDRLALAQLEVRLGAAIARRIEQSRRRIESAASGLEPLTLRAHERDRRAIATKDESLRRAIDRRLADARQALARQGRALHALSPLSVLDRGYAIATNDATGLAVRDPIEAPPGTTLRVRVARGTLRAKVIDGEE
ncbi:MAG: exodeoxyribonuclease VII large subunit [Deltaproteobacteria bacterium]|nr:exodeoxyribonuclease VII large subunit [Deltaproteobacteria bacterium]